MPELPRLSVIVVVFDMPRQAMNTLSSLSADYQHGVTGDEYEVIVVENESANMLDSQAVVSLGDNIRYFRRAEAGVSPVPALQFGVSQARGRQLGIIIDGAQMASPRVIEYALMADVMSDDAVVAVPGYHLGEADQKDHLSTGHSEELEKQRLQELDWQANGYRLFQFASFSSGNKAGYLQPMMESSALFCRTLSYQAIGGAPSAFDQPGGGSINLYLYRRLLLRATAQLFLLAGEGSFHQFHGGVTTAEIERREDLLTSFNERLREQLGEDTKSTAREPIVLGAVSHYAQPWLLESLQRSMRRFAIHAKQERRFWDDENYDYWTEDQPSRESELRSARPYDWEGNADG